uniref:WAP domain-containing protein n=1 Tax=Pundamilia nyererei TaxID=303518 RepID=A0A3B4H1U6_9CICH
LSSGDLSPCLFCLKAFSWKASSATVPGNSLISLNQGHSKPGSCPTADGLHPSSEECDLDIDCPGWQKCCQRSHHSSCSDPAS